MLYLTTNIDLLEIENYAILWSGFIWPKRTDLRDFQNISFRFRLYYREIRVYNKFAVLMVRAVRGRDFRIVQPQVLRIFSEEFLRRRNSKFIERVFWLY